MRLLANNISGFRKGSALVEISAAVMVMVVIGSVSFQSMMNTLSQRNWVVSKSLADAYLVREVAIANAIPFELISEADSNGVWPSYGLYEDGGQVPPSSLTILGRRSGTVQADGNVGEGVAVMGRVTRAREKALGLSEDLSETWRLRVALEYEANGKTYIASRTVVRTQ
ncbi:hypothetical protein [Persicirhabdus sediminis]|uniref:Uncharacterized protein n=1 Tax=Persicirhabdus sediminis TaxID=454144 RepID=A0A8J7MAJ9_9BACT|nr:hypothetical protein [Persicirhabdus sediminis]MBK1789582.1 hypothetical protein [Persicirhabdus sediminis]